MWPFWPLVPYTKSTYFYFIGNHPKSWVWRKTPYKSFQVIKTSLILRYGSIQEDTSQLWSFHLVSRSMLLEFHCFIPGLPYLSLRDALCSLISWIVSFAELWPYAYDPWIVWGLSCWVVTLCIWPMGCVVSLLPPCWAGTLWIWPVIVLGWSKTIFLLKI